MAGEKWTTRQKIMFLISAALTIFFLYILINISNAFTSTFSSVMNLTKFTSYPLVQSADFSTFINAVLVYVSIVFGFFVVILVEILRDSTIQDSIKKWREKNMNLSMSPFVFMMFFFLVVAITAPLMSAFSSFDALNYHIQFKAISLPSNSPTILSWYFCQNYSQTSGLYATINLNITGRNAITGQNIITPNVTYTKLASNYTSACSLLKQTSDATITSFSDALIFSVMAFITLVLFIALKLHLIGN
ncbi:Uncharacterised protein [uncultured archaeon]|nr:Uncharacterised protein [uncultured archaeon]